MKKTIMTKYPIAKRKMRFLACCLAAIVMVACSSNTRQAKKRRFYTPPRWEKPITAVSTEKPEKKIAPTKITKSFPTEQMTGYASWYGPGFHGKQTANGERFNQNKLTAAHKILPMNTVVKVSNLENNRSVIVRINDRGPYKDGRIIDLSREGARRLGFLREGVARVSLKVVKYPDGYNPETGLAPYKQVVVQVGVFSKFRTAFDFKRQLSERYKNISFIMEEYKNRTYRVIAGPYRKKSKAAQVSKFLKSKGVDNFVRTYKK